MPCVELRSLVLAALSSRTCFLGRCWSNSAPALEFSVAFHFSTLLYPNPHPQWVTSKPDHRDDLFSLAAQGGGHCSFFQRDSDEDMRWNTVTHSCQSRIGTVEKWCRLFFFYFVLLLLKFECTINKPFFPRYPRVWILIHAFCYKSTCLESVSYY